MRTPSSLKTRPPASWLTMAASAVGVWLAADASAQDRPSSALASVYAEQKSSSSAQSTPLQVATANSPSANTAPRNVAPTVRPATASNAGDGRFDLVVNEAPAQQVFMQIVQGSQYTMLVAPEVTGRITISLKNTTLMEALESLRDVHAYDFRVSGNRIYVQSNALQTRMFKVNYLPGQRRGTSDLRVSSSAIQKSATSNAPNTPSYANGAPPTTGTQQTNGGGMGASADETAHVRMNSDQDFWRDVKESLSLLLPSGDQRKVIINPGAGVILIRALPSELRQVEQYLKAVQINVERQVMIEAKILEVELSQDAQSGVNWTAFGNLLGRSVGIAIARPGAILNTTGTLTSDGTTITPKTNTTAAATGPGFYGLAFQSTNFAGVLNFLETQGKVQVLSSPRIATVNNQKAILKVGTDELYVTNVTSNSIITGTTTTSSPSLTLQPIFSGIALDVTPQIDADGMVMLHVHPSITSVAEKTKNIDLGGLGNFRLPLAASSVNETDSIVRVPNGQIVAIGGLMMQEQHRDNTGVPVLSTLPYLGTLFRQNGTVTRKREIVILMKPTVIKDDGPWPDQGAVNTVESQNVPAPQLNNITAP